jgi:hypothetical protein
VVGSTTVCAKPAADPNRKATVANPAILRRAAAIRIVPSAFRDQAIASHEVSGTTAGKIAGPPIKPENTNPNALGSVLSADWQPDVDRSSSQVRPG